MRHVVLDACVSLAWCFPDESSDYADAVLASLDSFTLLVPVLWGVEVANGLIVGERRRRLGPSEIKQFVRLLQNLSIDYDTQPAEYYANILPPLAKTYGLAAYDATYLELASRYNVPLATLDEKLAKACRKAGVAIFKGGV